MERYSLYGGEVELTFDPAKHHYRVHGEYAPSVTGIIDVLNKPALPRWAAKECSLYLLDNLEPGKALDEIEIADLALEMKRSPWKKSGRAADIGSLVHDWAESFCAAVMTDLPPPALPINEQARNSCEAFKTWWAANDIEPLRTEFKIYSRTHHYAGTCDLDAMFNGRRALIDFKSSSGIYDDMALQLAGYRQAFEEETGLAIDTGYIVRFDKTGKPFDPVKDIKEFPNYQKDLQAFLGALQVWRWQNERKRAA